jgi:trigger factor
MAEARLDNARRVLLDAASAALAQLVEEDPPEALVNEELRGRAENLVSGLQAQGVSMEQYLAMTGQDPATLTEGMKEAASRAVKVDLALRAVAEAEAIEVTDDDLEAEYQRIAVRVNQRPTQVRKAYERNDAVSGLKGELRKAKALDWLLHNLEMVDTEGAPIDREILLPEHDHDHDGDDHEGHDHDDHDGGDEEPAAASEAEAG